MKPQRIVILTGAGLSAESGISTFRDKGGIWSKYKLEEVATPEAFARDPKMVLDFYNQRRRDAVGVQPNAGHLALAELEQKFDGHVMVVTQNIDPLHEMAGTKNLIHMHGELLKTLCNRCNARHVQEDDLAVNIACPSCGHVGALRPDVVWFGEFPYQMHKIASYLSAADLFISIGTSGRVYPAAGFVEEAREAGAHTVELNLEPSDGASLFHEAIHGNATEIVPDYVAHLLDS